MTRLLKHILTVVCALVLCVGTTRLITVSAATNDEQSNQVETIQAVRITTQPQSVVVKKNGAAKVTVKASGDGLKYTWYYKDKGANKFTLASSFKSGSYSVAMTDSRAGRQVYCVVTDKYDNSVQTKTVTLSQAVRVTVQPQSVVVKKGSTAKVTVKASGDGLKYKWYYKDKGAGKFAIASSFKGSSYSIAMNDSRAGRQVYCVVTDKYGNSVQTKTVKLSQAVRITTQPQSVSVKYGSAAKVTVKASGDGLKYKWYYKDKGASKFTLTSSFKSRSYSVTMSDSRTGRQVYCVVTDKYGNSVQTKTVKLNQAVRIITQPKSIVVKAYDQARVTVKASGDGLKYKWYYKKPGADTFTYAPSFKTGSYYFLMGSDRNGWKAYCIITDKYGNSVKTDTVTIHLYVKIEKQPDSVAVKSGTKVKLTAYAEGVGLTYDWYYKDKDDKSYTLAPKGKQKASYYVVVDDNTDGRSVYYVVTDKFGNSVKSRVVTVNKAVVITEQPKSVYVPFGQTATVSVKASGKGLKYTWYYRHAENLPFKQNTAIKGNTYTSTMNNKLYSREQVYCVITDKFGNSVTTKTVTITQGLHIFEQPKSMVLKRLTGKSVVVDVNGMDLTFAWYYKTPDSDKFVYDPNEEGQGYLVVADKEFKGIEVYCVITDVFGCQVTTDIATVTVE